MATDKTEPPIKRIIGITLLSIGTLVGLRFAFQSYFIQNYESRQQEAVLGTTSDTLATAQREARAKLGGIAQAMDTAAGSNRPASIAPNGPPDPAARVGWGLMPTGYVAPAAAAPTPPVVPVAPPTPPAQPGMPETAPLQPAPMVPPANAPAPPGPGVAAPPAAPGAAPAGGPAPAAAH